MHTRKQLETSSQRRPCSLVEKPASRRFASGSDDSEKTFTFGSVGILAGLAIGLAAFSLFAPKHPVSSFAELNESNPSAAAAARSVSDDEDPNSIRAKNEARYADSAIVMVRNELDELLRRAEAFAADKSYRNATVLWNRVLDEGGSSLTTADGETYTPLVDRVERAIAQMPEEGLATYRIMADGEATAILAQSPTIGREAALGQVVERHFMSSLGDQAAFELAGYFLDRFDFVSATRLLEKIVSRHPDADVPIGQLHLRRAVCWAGLGDAKQSKAALDLALAARPAVPAELLEAVSQFVNSDRLKADRISADLRWGMPFGNSRRDGMMPRLPDGYLQSDLMVADSVELDSEVSNALLEATLRPFGNNVAGPTSPISSAIARAATQGWLPAQRAVLGPDGILVKGSRSPVYFRANSEGKIQPGWESLWFNMYLIDDASIAQRVNLAMYGNQMGATNNPTHPTELFLFGDTIHQSMAVIGDTAYVVEGQPYNRSGEAPSAPAGNNQGFFGAQTIRRSRTNWLTAYDVRSGRLRWTRAARDSSLTGGDQYEGMGGLTVPELAPDPSQPVEPQVDEPGAQANQAPANAPAQTPASTDGMGPDGLPLLPERGSSPIISNSVGYMGSPVAAGNLLILPLSDAGSMHLQAISPEDGKTVWRTPLCDAPPNGAPNFAPIHIAVEGQDLYVTCGMGLLFAINASDGRTRFARRYDRDPTTSANQQNNNPFGGGQMPVQMTFKGWSEDVVIPFQSVVVVASSDSDRMTAFDRTSGAFVWAAPRTPFADEMTYLLGVRGRYLYSAGRESILCYDLQGQGKLVWREQFSAESLGRGCLTEGGIYVPVQGSIVHYSYDLPAGSRSRKVTQVGVRGLGERPVGNLYCDGQRLWSLSAGRLLSLAPASAQLESLEERSEAGDPTATWERALLAMEGADHQSAERLTQTMFAQVRSLEQQLSKERVNIAEPEVANDEIANDEIANDEANLSIAHDLGLTLDRLSELRQEVGSLQFLHAAAIDSVRNLAVLRVLGLVAAETQGEKSWVDPRAFQKHRQAILALAAQTEGEWITDAARGWGQLLHALPSRRERMDLAIALAPGTGHRDHALHLIGSSDPGRILLGLAWLDSVSAAQATDRLVSLVQQDQWSEEIRAGALERLVQARHERVPSLAAAALSDWQSPQARLRVARAIERGLGEPLTIDVFAPPAERTQLLTAWLSNLERRETELSWRPFEPMAKEYFDRLLVGFPNPGLIIEYSSDGQELRRQVCEGMIAVAVDDAGDRWVAYPDRLEQLSASGEELNEWELPSYPRGIAICDGHEVFVALEGPPGRILIVSDKTQTTQLLVTAGDSIEAIDIWDHQSLAIAVQVTGRLQRWSRQGDPIETFQASYISGVSRLDNGHLLLTSALNAMVTEVDAEQRVVMRRTELAHARAAKRTQSGLTVVAYSQGIIALNRDSQEVWSVREHGPAITLAYF